MTDPVQVVGLKEFRRELKAAGQGLPKALGKANEAAGGLVVRDAVARARQRGGVAAKTVAENGLRTSKAANAVKVVLGGARVPYAIGAEFGAKQYAQFEPWRGNQWQPDTVNGVGYFLHPAIRATREEFVDTYARLLDDLMKRAFPDG